MELSRILSSASSTRAASSCRCFGQDFTRSRISSRVLVMAAPYHDQRIESSIADVWAPRRSPRSRRPGCREPSPSLRRPSRPCGRPSLARRVSRNPRSAPHRFRSIALQFVVAQWLGPARTMPDAQDTHLVLPGNEHVEDVVRIPHDREDAHAGLIGLRADARERAKLLAQRANASYDLACGLRVALVDVGVDFLELTQSAPAVGDPHAVSLANTAATSSSLATSPRRTSSSASRMSARSSSSSW